MKQTVLITGCSSGFGKAAALRFRQAGWKVAATMRNITDCYGADTGEDLLVLPLDLQNATSIQAALTRAIEHFGRIDCIVNNAGQGLFTVFETTPMHAVRALFEANFFGPMQLTQAVLPHFKSNGGGRVVNVSSASAIAPDALMSAYSATKWAVEGFNEAVRYELRIENIKIKIVEPGFVKETNIIPNILENSKVAAVPPSYQAYFDQVMAMHMGEQALQPATEADVAAAILAAASDETDQFRYVVGNDAKFYAHMRRETSETEYDTWAHSRFDPRTQG